MIKNLEIVTSSAGVLSRLLGALRDAGLWDVLDTRGGLFEWEGFPLYVACDDHNVGPYDASETAAGLYNFPEAMGDDAFERLLEAVRQASFWQRLVVEVSFFDDEAVTEMGYLCRCGTLLERVVTYRVVLPQSDA